MPRSRSRSPRRSMRGFKRYDRRRSPGFRRRISRSPKRRSRTHSPRRRSRSRSHSPRHRSRSHSPRRKSPPRHMSPPPRRDMDRMKRRHSPSPRRYTNHTSPKRYMSPSRSSGQRSSNRQRSPDTRDHDRGLSPPTHMQMKERESSIRNPDYSLPYQKESADMYPRYRDLSPSRLSPVHQRSPEYPSRRQRSPYSPVTHTGTIGSVTFVNTDRRRQLLSDRFRMIDHNIVGPIHIEDSITIGIHRSGPHLRENPNVPIIRDFDPDDFVMVRRKDEGERPIFDRDEIIMSEVYEERRTISVIPTNRYHRTIGQDDRQDTRVVRPSERPMEPKIRLDPKPDPRYEKYYKELKHREEEENRRMEKVQKNPNDLRHNLIKRSFGTEDGDMEQSVLFDARKKIEANRKDTGRSRSDIRSRDRDKGRIGQSRSHSDNRDRADRRRSLDERLGKGKSEKGPLPDFKNRPDKYKFDDWKHKPELIPKNPNYYEHDVREDEQFGRLRGRGRGGFRSRGSVRGTFRGRGFRDQRSRGRGYSANFINIDRRPRDSYIKGKRPQEPSSTGQWKHDLFDKLKAEEHSSAKQEKADDNRPTSTTK